MFLDCALLVDDSIYLDIFISGNKRKLLQCGNISKELKNFTLVCINKTMLSNQLDFVQVFYKDKEYLVVKIPYFDLYKLFVIDYELKDQLLKKRWHFNNGYISSTFYENKVKKELYLHNFLMGKTTFEGKGQHHTIDHINRVETDNRKSNLRDKMTQSEQNFNQDKRERTIKLPSDSDIDPNMLPRCVYYYEAKGNFGDYFEIEIKGLPNGDKLRMKTSKSKKLSLQCKLEEAKKYIREIIQKYSEHFTDRNMKFDYSDEAIESIKEYNEIIRLSGFDPNKQHVIEIPEKISYLKPIDESLLTTEERDFLAVVSINKTKGKKKCHKSKLPLDCGIIDDLIPPYVYYRPAQGPRGDSFIIERHPKMTKRCLGSTSSKSVSTIDKFKSILKELKELEKTDKYDEMIGKIENGQTLIEANDSSEDKGTEIDSDVE